MPSAASRMEGGTEVRAARPAMMMTGRVIRLSTSPPTSGAERGRPKKLMNTARPNKPNTMEGTAARLLMLTSIRSVQRFFGANSSRYTAVATPIGNDNRNVTTRVKNDPINAPRMPACSGSRESPLPNRTVLNCFWILPAASSLSIHSIWLSLTSRSVSSSVRSMLPLTRCCP